MVGRPVSTSINYPVALLIGRLKVHENIIDNYLWSNQIEVTSETIVLFLHIRNIREYPDTNVGMRKDGE